MTSTTHIAVAHAREAKRGRAIRTLLKDPFAIVAGAIVIVLVMLVLLADVFAPLDPTRTDLANVLAEPSLAHPLGTDNVGRDTWARLLHGGQLTLVGAALVLIISLVIGTVAGLLAGYYRSSIDAVTSWFSSLMMALPSLVVLLALRAVFGPSALPIMAAFGVLISPMIFQLVRASVRDVVAEPFIEAAKVSGVSDGRILTRHVLRAVRAPLIVQAMMVAGMAVGVQAALNFLGIGAGTVTWGGMLSESFALVYTAPQLMFWPALVLGAMTGSLIVLGNSLRDALDPRAQAVKRAQQPTRRARFRARSEAGGVARAPVLPPPATGSVGETRVDAEEPLLAVSGLAVAYPGAPRADRTVVRDVTLSIAAGEVVGLVGESGSGKSQIAFSVAGLLPREATIASGSIRFRGVELAGLTRRAPRPREARGIGYVPQDPIPNLDPSFTIGFQLTEPLRIARGMSRSAARTRALELLEAVSIREPERVLRLYPHQISGGMAQRVLIAGALALDPVLLVADEPTTALDVTVQAEILDVLRELQRTRDLAILLVTHDLGVAADLCDRIVVLRDGVIVESGETTALFSAPTADYTATLLASTLIDAPPRPELGGGLQAKTTNVGAR